MALFDTLEKDPGALRIREAFAARGIAFFGQSMTNQQFPILTKAQHAYFRDAGYLPE